MNNESKLREYEILPQATDKRIDDWLEPHYVAIDNSLPPQHKLFLFLCGSHGNPSNQHLIIQQAASLGYHAINLRYPNSWKIGDYCRRSNEGNCYENVRQTVIYGSQVTNTNKLKISRANSLENRLVKLLIYLYEKYPDDGWENYLAGLSPRWESIIVSGHSQGGGHAAMIAKDNVVAKVIMFTSPGDYSRRSRTMANWLGKDHATPTDRYYGFVHSQEQNLEKILRSWEFLGIDEYGEPVNVDVESPPYNYSHQLITSVEINSPRVHGSVVVDEATPKLVDGKPLYHQVWKYLLNA